MNNFKRNTDKKNYFQDYNDNKNYFCNNYSDCKISTSLRKSFSIVITIIGINEKLFNKLNSREKILYLNNVLTKYYKRYKINKSLLKLHNHLIWRYKYIKQFNKSDELKNVFTNDLTESTYNMCKNLQNYYLNINERKEKLYKILMK